MAKAVAVLNSKAERELDRMNLVVIVANPDRFSGLIKVIDFGQANACAAIGSIYNRRIGSGGQVEHDCRFRRIRRGETILLHIWRVNIILPVIIAGNSRAIVIVDRQGGIA